VTVTELFAKGGVAMWPLLGLSLLATGVICDRLWFWIDLFWRRGETVKRVLQAASLFNWDLAAQVSLDARKQPIGRFLHAPLRYPHLEPEVFKLALEASAERELTAMRQGEKILEAAIALAPLLGLLGTVLGLMRALSGLDAENLTTPATTGVTLGIGQSLIATATGLAIAITSLTFYRLFQTFLGRQVQIFRKAGNELELLYRQYWWQITNSPPTDTENFSNPSDPISQPPMNYEDLFGQ
jgi:biopolymer transport protein ExbB